jgi:hypothetical protein
MTREVPDRALSALLHRLYSGRRQALQEEVVTWQLDPNRVPQSWCGVRVEY